MNVILLSMPDSFEHMPSLGMSLPNCALSSLAGNVDSHHRVAVLDLVLAQHEVREIIEHLFNRFPPQVVGLSIMSFQRRTAKKIIQLIRWLKPDAAIVVGGYDPSLAPEAYTADTSDCSVDFIVRGEGETTFRELLRAIEQGKGYEHIAGLSYRTDAEYQHNADRPVNRLDDESIQLPDRSARVLDTYTSYGIPIDVVETSRGCTFDCSFCSIIEMRGRNFLYYPIERVIADIQDARDHGARAIFFVDDNITLNIERFTNLCQAIIDAGLSDLDYSVQAMTSAIANHGETLAPLMRKAGFQYVFLGIENIIEDDLAFLKASNKNIRRENGRRAGNATIKAIEYLHRHGMYVIGGLIVGNPDDTCESIEANLQFAWKYVDWPYIQHPTPYPRTPLEKEFREQGLIVNDRLEEYDGTTSVIRTKHLASEEVEFLRWRAERWMKLRHMVQAVINRPSLFFVRGNSPQVIQHTFRGSTIFSLLGLEDEHRTFERYRALRKAEREYL